MSDDEENPNKMAFWVAKATLTEQLNSIGRKNFVMTNWDFPPLDEKSRSFISCLAFTLGMLPYALQSHLRKAAGTLPQVLLTTSATPAASTIAASLKSLVEFNGIVDPHFLRVLFSCMHGKLMSRQILIVDYDRADHDDGNCFSPLPF